jgi:hypothetical protein
MENRDEWSGLASELLAELEPVAQRCKINTRSKRWPQTANSLSRRLNVVASNLAVAGIVIDRRPREAKRRTMTIRRTGSLEQPGETPVVAPEHYLEGSSPTASHQESLSFKPNDDHDDSDDVSGTPEGGPPGSDPRQGTLKGTRNTVTTVTTVIPAESRVFSGDDTDDDIPTAAPPDNLQHADDDEHDDDGDVVL